MYNTNMCGRYTLAEPDALKKRFATSNSLPTGVKPNYNTAPTQTMPVILNEGGKHKIELMQWGVIPVWAKGKKGFGFSTFNAKAETLDEKPMWKKLFKSKRCLVPATGFYEWKQEGSSKRPFLIHVKGQELFAMAGLYDSWVDDDKGEVVQTYTIITTTPNSKMKHIHDRMPVILDREEESMWLEEGVSDADLKLFLNPYEAKDIDMYEVDPKVGTVKGNNSIELTYPLKEK